VDVAAYEGFCDSGFAMQQRENADVEQGSIPRDRPEFPLGFQQKRNAPMYRPPGVTTAPDLPIPDKMKAWVLGDPDQLLLREKPIPVPARAEVLVRIDAVAICATDLEIIHSGSPASIQGGLPFNRNFTPGHEYMGTVAALGPDVDEFRIGERVSVEIHAGCGQCKRCRQGMYTSCLNYGKPEKGHRANGFATDGADRVVNISDENAVEVVRQVTGGIGADYVVECAGTEAALNQPIHMTNRGGKICLAAFPHEPATIDLAHLVKNNIYAFGIRGEGRSATRRAMALMAEKRFDATKIHTHTFPLADLPTALRYARDRVDITTRT
jgi:threonine dehydrogenase-like Zn-dependent dehydrogenase